MALFSKLYLYESEGGSASTDACLVVSVRDFLCLFRIRVLIVSYHLCLILVDVYASE